MGMQSTTGRGAASRIGLLLLLVLLGGCAPLWVDPPPGTRVHGSLDVPLERLRTHPDEYIGTVFEDRFKYYHIYHDRGTADLAAREQVILGKTHFTARPIDQYMHVVQIQITPRQERWLRAQKIRRQDVLKARVRFAGVAPGDALAFDLLRVE